MMSCARPGVDSDSPSSSGSRALCVSLRPPPQQPQGQCQESQEGYGRPDTRLFTHGDLDLAALSVPHRTADRHLVIGTLKLGQTLAAFPLIAAVVTAHDAALAVL